MNDGNQMTKRERGNMNNDGHVYAEVYKAVYAAHPGKMEPERRREAEHCAQQAVWTFRDTQPNHGIGGDP